MRNQLLKVLILAVISRPVASYNGKDPDPSNKDE